MSMTITQISVFVENKVGRLAEITAVIAKSGVDLRALSIADTSDFGILRLIVNDPAKTEAALKEAGLTFSINEVIAVQIDDRVGSLAEIVGLLNDNGIAIEYMYAYLNRNSTKAHVVLRVEDNEKSIGIFQSCGYYVLPSSEVYNM